jgi:hypothetical protein
LRPEKPQKWKAFQRRYRVSSLSGQKGRALSRDLTAYTPLQLGNWLVKNRTHPLLASARAHFEKSRSASDEHYLRPFKKHLVDITTSQSSLTRALTLANEIFNSLQKAGHSVLFGNQRGLRCIGLDIREAASRQAPTYYDSARWRPSLPTVTLIDGVAVGIALVEMAENVEMRSVGGLYDRESTLKTMRRSGLDHTWTTTKQMPSGRFRLIAYSPQYLVSWSTSWQETHASTLSEQLPVITKALIGIAADQRQPLANAERERERESERRQAELNAAFERRAREEDLANVHESEVASVHEIENIIEAWTCCRNVETFFNQIQAAAAELPTPERGKILSRLKLARDSIETFDPLTQFLRWKTPLERYQPKYPSHPDKSEFNLTPAHSPSVQD